MQYFVYPSPLTLLALFCFLQNERKGKLFSILTCSYFISRTKNGKVILFYEYAALEKCIVEETIRTFLNHRKPLSAVPC